MTTYCDLKGCKRTFGFANTQRICRFVEELLNRYLIMNHIGSGGFNIRNHIGHSGYQIGTAIGPSDYLIGTLIGPCDYLIGNHIGLVVT